MSKASDFDFGALQHISHSILSTWRFVAFISATVIALSLASPAGARQTSFPEVEVLAVSPDGKLLASTRDPGQIVIWSLTDYRELNQLQISNKDIITALALAPESNLVAGATRGGTIVVWELSSGRVAMQVERATGRDSTIEGLAFSPDGRRVATGSWDKRARVWEIATSEQIQGFRVGDEGDFLAAVAFSQSGNEVHAASHHGRIVTFSLQNGQFVSKREPKSGEYGWERNTEKILYSDSAKYVIIALGNGDVEAREARSGTLLKTLKSPSNNAKEIGFSDSQQTLAVADNKMVTIFDFDSGKLRHSFVAAPGEARISSLTVTPDGNKIIVGTYQGQLFVLSAETGQTLSTLQLDRRPQN